MRRLRVGDVLIKSREPITIDDETEYRQVTVRLKHQGVCLRGYKLGKEIGTKQQSVVRKGQFILSKIDARNGAFGIIPEELDGAIITNDFLTYDVNAKELNIELFRLLTSQATFDELCNKASTGTTNRKRLNEKKFLDQEITLPPIEEQDTFITHFKKIQSTQEQTLTELQTQSGLIAKLRSSILSDVVSGRLVHQDPADEPAGVLLERIQAEKEKLVKEGKIKKPKPLPPIAEDGIPYELPDGWVWCRLGELIESLQNGLSKRSGEKGSFVTVLRLADITNNKIDLGDTRSIRLDDKEQEKYSIQENDILITRVNGSIDIVGNFNTCIDAPPLLAYCDHFMRMRLFDELSSPYIALVEKTSIIRDVIKRVFKSTAGQKTVNQGHINSLLIPLPPLTEQHRIVTKVEKLMATCDALEAEVQKSRTETDRLMQSILKEAFANEKESQEEAKAPKPFQRSVLAAYFIDNSQDDPYFGHVKLQKMLFMSEAVNNLDFNSDYKRHAMGPYDPKLIRSVDAQLKKAKWFEVKKSEGEKGRYVYHPMAKAEEYKKYLGRYWDQGKIEKIFELMHPMKTQQAEIVATLYSAWMDLNKDHASVSDEMLIDEARNNWHDNKKKISVEKWQTAIGWMRGKNILS